MNTRFQIDLPANLPLGTREHLLGTLNTELRRAGLPEVQPRSLATPAQVQEAGEQYPSQDFSFDAACEVTYLEPDARGEVDFDGYWLQGWFRVDGGTQPLSLARLKSLAALPGGWTASEEEYLHAALVYIQSHHPGPHVHAGDLTRLLEAFDNTLEEQA